MLVGEAPGNYRELAVTADTRTIAGCPLSLAASARVVQWKPLLRLRPRLEIPKRNCWVCVKCRRCLQLRGPNIFENVLVNGMR